MRVARTTAALVLLLATGAALRADRDVRATPRRGNVELTRTLAEVVGVESAGAMESVVPSDEPITWSIFVPDSYRPEEPAGLMVYISPSPSGAIPREWRPALDRRNTIWIGASDSGNEVAVARRALYALIAPTVAGKSYNLDPERIYLSGYSGGGRVASMVAVDYPQVFKGAIYNCGAEFWRQREPRRLDLVRQNRYVFVSGTRDHALRQTKKVHGEYLESGVASIELVVVRGMPHGNPDGHVFGRAIDYLDARLAPEASGD